MNLYDPNDGLPVSEMGAWAEDKHERLKRYVDISREARKKYLPDGRSFKAGATYIDLFCGAGRGKVKGEDRYIDGSALAAYKKSVEGGYPFSEVHIGDKNLEYLEACAARLRKEGAEVVTYQGTALENASSVVNNIHPKGLHFAFLDPYNLKSLDFRIFENLARLEKIDIIAHLSAMDLQMNLSRYRENENSSADFVAPGWREKVEGLVSEDKIRQEFIKHWKGLFRHYDLQASPYAELVSGDKNQRLYWLVFIARHRLAEDFWNKIRNISKQKGLDLDF